MPYQLPELGLAPETMDRLTQAGAVPAGAGVLNMLFGRDRSPIRRAARGGLGGLGALGGGVLGHYLQSRLGGAGVPEYAGPGVGAALGGLVGYNLLGSDEEKRSAAQEWMFGPQIEAALNHPEAPLALTQATWAPIGAMAGAINSKPGQKLKGMAHTALLGAGVGGGGFLGQHLGGRLGEAIHPHAKIPAAILGLLAGHVAGGAGVLAATGSPEWLRPSPDEEEKLRKATGHDKRGNAGDYESSGGCHTTDGHNFEWSGYDSWQNPRYQSRLTTLAPQQKMSAEPSDPSFNELALEDEMEESARQWSPGENVGTPLGQIVASPARQALLHGLVGAPIGALAGAQVGSVIGGQHGPGAGAMAGMAGVGGGAALMAYLRQRQSNQAAGQLAGV